MPERVYRIILGDGCDASGLIEGPLNGPGVERPAEVRAGKDETPRRAELLYTALQDVRSRWADFYQACLTALRGSEAERTTVIRLINAHRLILDEHMTFLQAEQLPNPEPAARVDEEGVGGPDAAKLPRR